MSEAASAGQGRWGGRRGPLRPAEWFALAFVAYLGLRAALAPPEDVADQQPRFDMLAALLVAVAGRQLWRYRKTPWGPALPPGLKWVHWALVPLALAPLGLELEALSGLEHWGTDHGYLWEAPLGIVWVGRRLALAGLPLLLAWLALGLHLKEHGRIDPGRFLRESARGAFGAVRAWLPPVLLVFMYGSLRGVLDRGDFPDQDALLYRLDTLLFLGHDPHRLLESVARPWLSAWMSFCYIWYAPLYPICFGFTYALAPRRSFEELATAITAVLAIGFTTYTFVPAQGPMYTRHFDVPLDGYYLQWAIDMLMNKYRVPRDCFPSLHTAISLTFLAMAYRHVRPLFWVSLPFVITIPVACVYMRYHYVTDVVAGTLLAAAAVWAAPRLVAWYEGEPHPAASGVHPPPEGGGKDASLSL